MSETENIRPSQVKLGPDQGIIHRLDNLGDTRLIWSRGNDAEVAAARNMFNELRGKKFTGYRAEGKEGTKGSIITEFDPSAERIIMVPPVAGGCQ